MRKLTTILFVFTLVFAQAGELVNWSKGSVVQKDGQVKLGEVSFQSVDLILFKTDGKVSVYTPHQIKAFFYYDEDARINRKFNSVKVTNGKTPLFYEYVVWGKIQMLRVAKNRNLIKGKLRDTYDYEYFVCWGNNYVKVKDFKKEVYPLLVENSPILDQMVQKERLKTSSLHDVASIIKLYNRVINEPIEIMARR